MTKEEMLREEGAGDDESGPRPQGSPGGPIEPVAKEFIVGAPGAAGVGLLKGLQPRKILVGLVVIALVGWGFLQLMPKGAEGEAVALKFAPGQTNRYRMFMVFDGTRVLPPKGKQQTGKQQTFHTTMGATVDTEVATVDATGATVDVTLSNFALHTGTPAFDVVPGTIHTQMHVDETGAVTSGGLGLSAAVASKIIPGWDVLIPPLPPGAVLPGATWKSSTDSAFAGSETVHVSADSTLISFVAAGSQRMAVVTSKMVIPVDKTVSMQSMADALGADLGEIGFPEGSETELVYKGQIGLDSLARIDVASGQIFSNYTRGTATYTETITGWPPTLPEEPSGEVNTSVTFSMSLKQQPPGEASPAEPKKSPGAKSSPTPNGAG